MLTDIGSLALEMDGFGLGLGIGRKHLRKTSGSPRHYFSQMLSPIPV
jgi:hypothetical protein